MSLSKFEKQQVDYAFRRFADSLKPDDAYHDEGIRLCERVRQLLEEECSHSRGHRGFSIASTFYGGSIGKKTDLRSSDFDMVLKINNRDPPFTDVLYFIEGVLQNNVKHFKILPWTIHKTRYSIQWTFRNKIKVDLLPACADLSNSQIYRRIRRGGQQCRYYGSSLVEQQISFMKEQGALAHAVARLAKHWFKRMDIGGAYVAAGSTIFELLAVAAVLEQKKEGHKESVLEAFAEVAEMVKRLDNIGLIFERSNGSWGPWRVKILNSEESQKPYPFVREPANYYNNLLHGMTSSVMRILKKNGSVMLCRLKDLMRNGDFIRGRAYDNDFLEINFDKLFKTVSND